MANNDNTLEITFFVITLVLTLVNILIAYRSAKIAQRNIIDQWLADLQKWAEISIEVMTKSSFIYFIDPKQKKDIFSYKHNILAKISTLLDQGRYFYDRVLPKDYKKDWDNWKIKDLKDYLKKERKSIDTPLYYLKRAFDELTEYDYNKQLNGIERKEKRQEGIDLKKCFVRDTWKLLNPKRRFKYSKNMIKQLKKR